ncbi:hypothetical protein ZWY2020_038788 [Hordeum vulgare]|nr:hypothetical protein ZWY2020_038788 [Hordeum vulgare]
MDNGKERGIGFWTALHGLSRYLDRGSNESSGKLRPVIWPGDSTVRPRGWVQPTSARKLRVAVPGNVSDSYKLILRLEVDPETNETTASGFVIEVFEAAVRLLPYALPFEYVKAASMPYDELVKAVGNGTFDAAVADITMTANRSVSVDFTLPYTGTAIAMVVPVRDHRSSKRTWIFLKPLRYDLWIVSTAFFLFTGFVVWAIEHRGNEDFRGPPSYQLGTLLYFSFSTLVFATGRRSRATSRGSPCWCGSSSCSSCSLATRRASRPCSRCRSWSPPSPTTTSSAQQDRRLRLRLPKGSPYVTDLSKAILKLTESDEMNMIERKWFGDADDDSAMQDGFTSNSLSFNSFWGLFLITSATSLLCCVAHLANFVATSRRELPPHLSWKDRLWMLFKLFDDRDPRRTFRVKDDGGGVSVRNSAVASPRVAHSELGSPLSAPYTSEWSGTASPAVSEIELAAGGQERDEAAPNPDGSGENGRGP